MTLFRGVIARAVRLVAISCVVLLQIIGKSNKATATPPPRGYIPEWGGAFGALSLVPQIAAYHKNEPNFLSEGVRLGLSQKMVSQDSTKTYSLRHSTFSDGPRMTPYHKKDSQRLNSGTRAFEIMIRSGVSIVRFRARRLPNHTAMSLTALREIINWRLAR